MIIRAAKEQDVPCLLEIYNYPEHCQTAWSGSMSIILTIIL